MSKDYLTRAAGAGRAEEDTLLPPLPPLSQCYHGTYYLDSSEAMALKLALVELQRDTGVHLPLTTLIRLALLAVVPTLNDLARQKQPLTRSEMYRALLERLKATPDVP